MKHITWPAWVLFGLLCAPLTLSAGHRDDAVGVELSGTIREAQQAIQAWDFSAMTNSSAHLAAASTTGTEEAFQKRYWRGIVLLHALFYARESTANDDISTQAPELHQEALAALEQIVALRNNTADAHAAVAVLLGMSIHDGNWLTALRLGPRLMRHKKAAEKSAPNPRVEYLNGVGLLRSARKKSQIESARRELLGAIKLFEAEAATPASHNYTPRWGYEHALMFLGDACAQLGRNEEAMKWHTKAQQVNPHAKRTGGEQR